MARNPMVALKGPDCVIQMSRNPMVYSLVQSVWYRWQRNPWRTPWSSLCATDVQEPHGGLLGPVCVSADGQEPLGRLPGPVCVLQMPRKPMADSLVQSVTLQMARNPMVDSVVQSECYRWPGNPWWTPWSSLCTGCNNRLSLFWKMTTNLSNINQMFYKFNTA